MLPICIASLVCLIAWAIPLSHAYLFMGPSTSMTFGHTYHFPTVPYSEGVRHIHTLEHLQNISVRKRDSMNGMPYFRIDRVAQPIRYGEYVSVTAHCLIMGIPQTVCMLSRPGMENTSTYMCLQDGTQQAMIQLKVSELGRQGHTLSVESTYFTRRRLLDTGLEPVMRFLRFFETRSRHRGPFVKLHPNLMWYRRMVLGLIGREGVMGLD